MSKMEQLQKQKCETQSQLEKTEVNIKKLQKSLTAARSDVRAYKKSIAELENRIVNQKKIDIYDKIVEKAGKEIDEDDVDCLVEWLQREEW